MEDSTKNNWNWTVKSKTEDDFSEVSVSNEERQSVDNPVDAPSFRRNVSTVDLEALMEKYKKRYSLLCKKNPAPPVCNNEVDVSDTVFTSFYTILFIGGFPLAFLFAFHILSWVLYLFTFTFWDRRDITWGYITNWGLWVLLGSVALFVLIGVYYLFQKLMGNIRNNQIMKQYEKECAENKAFNENLIKNLTDELNSVLKSHNMEPVDRLNVY